MRKRPADGRQIYPGEELRKNSNFIVKRFNGKVDEKVVAVLIDTKEVSNKELQKNRDEKKEKNLHNPGTRQERLTEDGDEDEAVPNSESPTKRMHRLYYIHYIGMDRRMDEWVERERFVEFAPAGAEILPPPKINPGVNDANQQGTITRSQRRIHEEFHHVQKSYDDMDAFTAKLEKEHEERTKVKNIQQIILGSYEISTWYFSPFPEDCAGERLYICEYCLVYTPDQNQYLCHKKHTCKTRQPPGDEIYRSGKVSVFEIDGRMNKVYCQCLCLLSKLFMDHKTLYYDVDTFLFYVLCEVDEYGAHIVGHFSKERMSENNLACIMILPPYQRKGYGKLLIQLSYELSKREGWIGTPEKPLSDLGKVSYRSYWWWRLLEVMDKLENVEDITARELSIHSGISEPDIVSTLQTMQMVKYWKGSNEYVVRVHRRIIDHCKSLNMARAPKLLLDPTCMRWSPVVTRSSPLGSQD
ncbi:unnamed protein product [Auanema sp. JU1783]|nr:unnamed protein product [Auanema sp. JU1783]